MKPRAPAAFGCGPESSQLPIELTPFLFQKARRLLPVTVKSDSGLAEGEIWFIDGREITFWCVEKLEAASRYEMRADVKTLGRNVDLVVEILEVMAGRDAAAAGGFLHQGEFITLEDADEERLLKRFWQLNPECAPDGVELDAPSRPAVRPARDVPQPARRQALRSASPRATESPRSASPRSQEPRSVRSQGPRSSASVRSRTGRDQGDRRPTPGERRRLRTKSREGKGVPKPPLVREQRVKPEVAPGDPPSVMLQYSHREILQADALLRDDELWMYVGGHPLLWEGQELALFLQLPAGNVLQLRGVVVAARIDHCVIQAPRLHAAMLSNLKAALGA
jgi:hypothetical protein